MHKDFFCFCETECGGAEDERVYYRVGVGKPCFPCGGKLRGSDPLGHISEEL